MNKVINKAGTYTLQPGSPTGLSITGGSFYVRSNVNVSFSHAPDFVIEATPGRDIPVPQGELDPDRAFTVTTNVSAQVKLWWTSAALPAPVPEPEPEPVPTPIPEPVPTPTPTPEPVPVPPTPAPGAKRVLSPSDLQYLGAMRVPESGVDMMYSYGGMTGRKVNGKVHLLMVGSTTVGDPVYELADTGSYHTDVAQAPRMSLVRYWGKIYGAARTSWNADGSVRSFPDTNYISSFYFNESTQLLYWTYVDVYNVSGNQDWCLGATRLDASGPVAFGPWRPSGAGGVGGTLKGPWRCLRITQHPVTGELLCGSGLLSGNGNSPWGPDLWAGSFPTESTPSGFGAPDLPLEKYLTYYPMFADGSAIALDGSFVGPLKSCRRPGDYVFEPIPNITLTEIDPQKNNGVGSWTANDGMSGATWIDLPDAHGVIFTGKLAGGHVWYRNAGGGHGLCTHGVESPVDITGPVSSAPYPSMFFYDPSDLNAVRAGAKVDYTVEAAHVVNAESRYGVLTAGANQASAGKVLGGNYFDRETRKLYVAAPLCDPSTWGFIKPIVHVFQVAG